MNDVIQISYALLFPMILLLVPLFIVIYIHHLIDEFSKNQMLNPWVAAVLHPLLGIKNVYRDNHSDEKAVNTLETMVTAVLLYYVFLGAIAIYFKIPVFSTPLVWIMLLPVAVYFVVSRIWGLRVVMHFKKQKNSVQSLHEVKENKLATLVKVEQRLKNLQQQLTNKEKSANDLSKQLSYKLNNWERMIEDIQDEQEYIEEIFQKVHANLSTIDRLEPNAEIAIDTNVLMEWDTYLLDAFRSRSLVISKRVQRELDKNKSKDDELISYKARQGIRYLLSLSANDYTLICSQWDKKEMEAKGISPEWEDERIIADYYSYKQQNRNVYIASDDANFIISAKPHFPLLRIPYPKIFNNDRN